MCPYKDVELRRKVAREGMKKIRAKKSTSVTLEKMEEPNSET